MTMTADQARHHVATTLQRLGPAVASRLDANLREAFESFEQLWRGAFAPGDETALADRLARFHAASASWEKVLALFPASTSLTRPRKRRRSSLDRRLESHARKGEELSDLGARLESRLSGQAHARAFPLRLQSNLEKLGLEQGAGPDDVKLAYRALARESHPDLVQASDSMAELNLAYGELLAWLKETREPGLAGPTAADETPDSA